MREYKVVIAGNGGVGKSALTVQFVQGMFVALWDVTIEDSYRKLVKCDGEDCRIEILDTAGTEQFSGMRDLYARSGQGFVLVYSVDDEHSFRQIESIADHIFRIKGQNPPMVLIGNKSDLATTQRRIQTEEGKALAQKLNCHFYESSAKLNENVSEIFFDILRQIRQVSGEGGTTVTKKKKNECCALL